MRTLIYATVFILSAAALIPANYASARENAGKFPHIDSSVQFPPTKARNFRQTFRLHVTQNSSAISQLSIEVPAGLTVRNNISVSDQSGRKIDTNVSVNGSKVIMMFAQPVVPETVLNIDMNDVRRTGVSNAWLYPITARFVGINADIPIGVAQFRVY